LPLLLPSYLKEDLQKGAKKKTIIVLIVGIVILILSTFVVKLG